MVLGVDHEGSMCAVAPSGLPCNRPCDLGCVRWGDDGFVPPDIDLLGGVG